MPEKWLVLVCDDETGKWTIACESNTEQPAREVYRDMREGRDSSPAIIIYTGDYVTV